MDVLKQQYDLVKNTRESLFQFCETIKPDDFIKELDGFGWGSIRNLHVHVSQCYTYWLSRFGLKETVDKVDPASVKDVRQMRELFKETDKTVYKFLNEFEGNYEHKIKGEVEEDVFSVLWLMTHTMTHEFHHKGQIVSMARQLGYTPPDTDLV